MILRLSPSARMAWQIWCLLWMLGTLVWVLLYALNLLPSPRGDLSILVSPWMFVPLMAVFVAGLVVIIVRDYL